MPHNIGRTWNSPYGIQTIVRHDPHPSGALYAVETAESGAIRLYPVARIEEVIKADEYRTTQAYQDELKEREEMTRLREAERIKREHGYCTRFYRVDNAMLRALHGAALAEIMEDARAWIMSAKDKAEICDIATSVKIKIRMLGGDYVLPSLAWSNGVFTMARKFRKDIWN